MSYDTPEGADRGSATPPPGPYDTPGGPDAGQTMPPSGAYGSYGSYPSYGTHPSYGVPPGGYGKPPPSYRGWTITCIVCGVLFSIIIGLPCALAAQHYSRKVQRAWNAGDQQGAAKASRTTMIWAIVATVFEALGLIFVITLVAHGGSSTT
jgi:Interferon-induced transmembrane protein